MSIIQNYLELLIQDINKIEFKYDEKSGIYTSLFISAIEHCISIDILNKKNLTTSMYALLRPATENYLRAMWVKYCDDVGSLNEESTEMHFPTKIEVLIEKVIEKKPELESSYSLKTKLESTSNMHDFTHGGIQSIARQYDEARDVLTDKRDEAEITSILKFIVLISSLAYSEVIKENIGNSMLHYEAIRDLAKKII